MIAALREDQKDCVIDTFEFKFKSLTDVHGLSSHTLEQHSTFPHIH